jgi:hypothetical protein
MHKEILLIVIVMAYLFAVAIYCAFAVRARYRAVIVLPPESLLLVADPERASEGVSQATWEQRYLDALPSVFLIVGLFGTFVGLAISIDSAGEALVQGQHSTQDLQRQFDALSRAVNAIGVKFLSSLFGIGFHLASRLLLGILVSPLQHRMLATARRARDEVREEQERARDTRQRELVEKISSINARLSEVLVLPEVLQTELESLAKVSEATKGTVQSLDRAATHATEVATKFEEALRAMKALGEEFLRGGTDAGAAMTASVDRFNASLHASCERIAQSMNTSGVQIDNGVRTLRLTLDRQTQVLNQFASASDGMAERFDRAALQNSTASEVLSMAMVASVDRFNASVHASCEHIAQSMNTSGAQIDDGVRTLRLTLDRQIQVLNQFASASNGMAERFDRAALQSATASETLSTSFGVLRGSIDAQARTGAELTARTMEAVERLAAALQQSSVRVERGLDRLDKGVQLRKSDVDASVSASLRGQPRTEDLPASPEMPAAPAQGVIDATGRSPSE